MYIFCVMYFEIDMYFTWFSERFIWFLGLRNTPGFIWFILKKKMKKKISIKKNKNQLNENWFYLCPNKTVEYLLKIWIFWSDILFLVDVSPSLLSSLFFFLPLPEILGIIKKTLGYTVPTEKPCLTATSVMQSQRYYGHFFWPPGKTTIHVLVKNPC